MASRITSAACGLSRSRKRGGLGSPVSEVGVDVDADVEGADVGDIDGGIGRKGTTPTTACSLLKNSLRQLRWICFEGD
jgi:hypothetical protein